MCAAGLAQRHPPGPRAKRRVSIARTAIDVASGGGGLTANRIGPENTAAAGAFSAGMAKEASSFARPEARNCDTGQAAGDDDFGARGPAKRPDSPLRKLR